MNMAKCSCKGYYVGSLVCSVEMGPEGISEVGPSRRISGQVLKGREHLKLTSRGGSPQSHPDWLPAWQFSHWLPQMLQLLPSAVMSPHRNEVHTDTSPLNPRIVSSVNPFLSSLPQVLYCNNAKLTRMLSFPGICYKA